jgi:hypothetical protein
MLRGPKKLLIKKNGIRKDPENLKSRLGIEMEPALEKTYDSGSGQGRDWKHVPFQNTDLECQR